MHKSYYAIIPASVRYDKELTPNAKLLYGEITALCNEKGYCWASNGYFSELYQVSKVSISNWIKQLAERGYIKTQVQYKEGTKEISNRYITIVNDPIKESFNTPQRKVNDPIKENFKDNNTSNNTSNNTVNTTTNNNANQLQANEQLSASENKMNAIDKLACGSGDSAFEFYQENFGMISPHKTDILINWINELSEELVLAALKLTDKKDARSPISFMEGILKNWQKANVKTVEDARAFELKHKRQYKQSNYRKKGYEESKPFWFDQTYSSTTSNQEKGQSEEEDDFSLDDMESYKKLLARADAND